MTGLLWPLFPCAFAGGIMNLKHNCGAREGNFEVDEGVFGTQLTFASH